MGLLILTGFIVVGSMILGDAVGIIGIVWPRIQHFSIRTFFEFGLCCTIVLIIGLVLATKAVTYSVRQ